MPIGTLVIFIVISLGLGYTALLLAKPQPVLETLALSFVIGIAILPLLLLLLRALHVPLDVRIIGPLSLVGVAVGMWRRHVGSWKMPAVRAVAICVAIVSMLLVTKMMYDGALRYPYLEDDDPWKHAVAARYVAIERTTDQGPVAFAHTLEPYPPYYSAMMGVLHQTTPDLRWVLKFFNALLVGMSVLAAYFAFELLLRDSVAAAAAAAILGAIPAYMSHFIWSQTLAIPVFLIALWALEHWRHSLVADTENMEGARATQTRANVAGIRSGWWARGAFRLAALLVWSATIIQPSTAVVFAFLFVVYGVVVGLSAALAHAPWPFAHSLAVVAGGVMSFLTWGSFTVLYGWTRLSGQIGVSTVMFSSKTEDTSGGIVYSVGDIVFAPFVSKIDQATGLGPFVVLLALVSIAALLYNWRTLTSQKNAGALFLLLMLVVSMIGVQGNALPYKLFPHRFWVFLAIPVAALAAITIVKVADAFPRRIVRYLAVIALVGATLWTALPARMAVQQAQWPPGVIWTSHEELAGYIALPDNLPMGSRVFAPCTLDEKVIGNNMAAEPWVAAQRDMKKHFSHKTTQEIIAHMITYRYEYLTLDASCTSQIGQHRTQEIADSLAKSGRFTLVVSAPGFMLVKMT